MTKVIDDKLVIDSLMSIGHTRQNATIVADLTDKVIDEIADLILRKASLLDGSPVYPQFLLLTYQALKQLSEKMIQDIIDVSSKAGVKIVKD